MELGVYTPFSCLLQTNQTFFLQFLKTDYNAHRLYRDYNHEEERTKRKTKDVLSRVPKWWSSASARRQASRLLTNVHIQDFLKSKTDDIAWKLWLSVEWVLQNLKDVTEKCMEAQPVTFKNWKQVTTYVEDEDWEEVKAAVYRFDSAWANSALEKIWKYFKMFTDKVEQSWDISINVISYKKDKWQN